MQPWVIRQEDHNMCPIAAKIREDDRLQRAVVHCGEVQALVSVRCYSELIQAVSLGQCVTTNQGQYACLADHEYVYHKVCVGKW